MTNIGVFDSGVGGLTVLSKLVSSNKANYFYFGDSLRAPYGDRDKGQIIEFTKEIVDFLEGFDIDKYVIACNTISVLASDDLSMIYQKEFIPITEAGVELARNYGGDYLILATKTTVDSHYYKSKLENSKQKVTEIAGQELVELIENNDLNSKQMDDLLRLYLKDANDQKIENIILGCTHFPIAKEAIERNLTYKANIINPADGIVGKINSADNKEEKVRIFMSEINDNSKKIIETLIDKSYDIELKEL